MSKKKRGRAPESRQHAHKRQATIAPDETQFQPSRPCWSQSPGVIDVVLDSGQSVILTGCFSLQVRKGAVEVGGKLLYPESSAVDIIASGRGSGAALVTGVHHPTRAVPLAPCTEVQLSVQSLSPGLVDSAAGGTTPAEWSEPRVFLADSPEAPACIRFSDGWCNSSNQICTDIESAAHSTPTQIPLVTAICGSKGVGKSTYARMLVNKLLNSFQTVAYLDSDCGQPEFTAPGLVSLALLSSPLLNAPHLNAQQPALSMFIGDVSPESNPGLYLKSILALYKHYCMQLAGQEQAVPLVVNTHGWIKGLGLDLLTDILQGINPGFVVELQAANPRKNLPDGYFWTGGEPTPARLLYVPAAGGVPGCEANPSTSPAQPLSPMSGNPSTSPRGLSAVEVRSLQWLTFARCCVAASPANPSCESEDFCRVVDALAAHPPYVVSMDDVRVETLYGAVDPCQLGVVLNGAVVGLVAGEQGQAGPGEAGSVTGLAPCVALGIVRSVDAKQRLLYILTPAPEAVLEGVTSLQVGRLELPSSLMQSSSLASPYLSLFCMSAEATGAGVVKARNNLLRSSLL